MTAYRFAVDKMLGRLATWLRLTGHDATYGAHLSGKTLVRHARAEQRIILTRDHHILRECQPPTLLLIESDHFRHQLHQVVQAFSLDVFAQLFTRCVRCNTLVEVVDKPEIIGQVPPHVAATQQRFARCPRCRRVYWPATHSERVREELCAMGFRPGRGS